MVPNGWKEVYFGDCIEHKGGTALEKYVMGGAKYHFISIGNYSVDGRYIDKGQRIELNDKTKAKLLDKNDLVMVLNDKTKTGDIIGSTILIDEDDKYIYNQRSERVVCNDGINTLFFWFLLNSKPIRTEVFGLSQGGTQIYVNFGALKSIILNLPPLPEQQKIAKILTTWDKAISTTERLIDNSTQQKKALMQQLLTGKKRVLDDAGKQFAGDWDWVNLEDVCDVKGGKRLPKGNALLENKTSHPYIRVADMYMGGVDLTDIKYVPESIAPLIKNYTISKDDLFITVAGTLGIVGSIPDELDGANLTENADKLTNIKCNKTFLLYVMTSSIIQRYVEAESTQNAQPKLALVRIRGFKVPLPKPEEQQKIATVLTNADQEIDLLKQQLADLQQEKKALMQVLLTGKRRVVVEDVIEK